MNKLPISQFPKSVRAQLETVAWVVDHPRLTALLALGALTAFVTCAGIARASCGSISERLDMLCYQLGFPPGETGSYAPCDIRWETDDRGRYLGGWGELMLIADDNVDEPLLGSPSNPFAAVAMRFRTSRGTIPKIFGAISPQDWWEEVDKRIGDKPCISPKCSLLQAIYGPDAYIGVSEWELMDPVNVSYRLPFQKIDPRMEARIQRLFKARGHPIAVWAGNPRTTEGTADGTATELVLDVFWGFAMDNE